MQFVRGTLSGITRILIVDDDECIRTLMSLVLAEVGYQVSSAEDGFSALRKISRESPESLLSDLNMPGMFGFELLWVVRRRLPAILAIAMSGAFSGNEMPSGVSADAFYQKGSRVSALLQILRTPPKMRKRKSVRARSVRTADREVRPTRQLATPR
jgi:DNA-binding NtrC family response regulator